MEDKQVRILGMIVFTLSFMGIIYIMGKHL